MIKKSLKQIFLILLIFIFIFSLTNFVSAIGLTPPAKDVKFEPGLALSWRIGIFDTVGKPVNVQLSVEIDEDYSSAIGERDKNALLEGVSIYPNTLSLKSGELKEIEVSLKLPEYFDRPGRHFVFIRAQEVNPGSEGTVGGVAAVRHPIFVDVAYPGKYVILNLGTPTTSINQPIIFNFKATNKGDEKINKAESKIYLYHTNGTKFDEIKMKDTSIYPGETVTFEKKYETKGLTEGVYTWRVEMDYDGNFVARNSTFKIGILDLLIINYTKEVEKSNLAPIDIEVESMWNQKINDVFADLIIREDETERPKEIRTPTYDFEPFQTRNLSTYWDISRLNLGDYNATIKLYFEDKVKTKDVVLSIIKPAPEKRKFELFTTTNLIILILIIIILINIIIFMLSKKKKKEEENPESSETTVFEEDKKDNNEADDSEVSNEKEGF